MSRESNGRAVSWPRRILKFIGFFSLSLVVGAVVERVMDVESIEAAHAAQERWLEATKATAPFAVAHTYWVELQGSLTGDRSSGAWSVSPSGGSRGAAAPFAALVFTIAKLAHESGLAGAVQVVLAVLGALVFFVRRARGHWSAILDQPYAVIIGAPLLVMAGASVLGLALWWLMVGALTAFGIVTGLAGTMAGATGVVGFCWMCVGKLMTQAAEHALTSRL